MTDKTLKDFFEVYKPKSPDEQKFVDKHVTIKHKDRNGNGDDVFKATNIKTIKRKEERHGYDSGEDEKVYEEVDELDELSQKMVRAYRDKARDDKDDAEDDREFYKAHDDSTDAEDKKIRKRAAGIKMADKKIHGGANVRVKEEVEIDALLDQALDMLNSIDEKTLTPAEMKKREEVVKAIKRGDPKMDKSMAYAIATKTAKRVAEGTMPTADEPSDADKKTAQKVRDLLAKEKKPVKEAAERQVSRDEFHRAGGYKNRMQYSTGDEKNKKYWTRTPVREEAEDLDESAKIAAHLIKRYGDNVRKSHVRSAANDFGVGYVALSHAVRKKLGVHRLEEAEDLDEISLGSYFDKALDSGVKATQVQYKKGASSAEVKAANAVAAKRGRGLKMASKRMTQEEVEIDESSSFSAAAKKAEASRQRAIKRAAKAYKLHGNMDRAISDHDLFAKDADKIRAHLGEEAQGLDEISPNRKELLGRYINRAKDQIDAASYRQGHRDSRGSGGDPVAKGIERKLSKRHGGIELAVKKLTKEDIINKAISKYVAEDHELPSIDDRFLAAIEHLPESHIATLFGLFDNLSEENQLVMIDTVATTEGVNSLIDFAIENTRGE